MDFVIGRGAKFSYLLLQRSPKCFSKLPSFLNEQHKVTTCWHIQYLGKHSASSCQSNYINAPANRYDRQFKQLPTGLCLAKVGTAQFGTSTKSNLSEKKSTAPNEACSPEKPSVFKRMKQMTKDYWHILIPVHIVTSIGWASMFYIAAKNGVDIVGMLESLNLSEKYLEMVRGSNAGHWAVTYALYKVFTPLRYTVTVGGTTMTIRYLNKWGIMKFKKDSKLSQSLRSAKEHMTSYGKSAISGKVNQSQPPKT